MSLAHSAPAYPPAPNTATLGWAIDSGVTDTTLELLSECAGDPPAPTGDLLVGERAVGRPEAQPQRERDLALTDPLGIAVHVEDLRVAQQRTARLPDDGEHLGGRHRVRD